MYNQIVILVVLCLQCLIGIVKSLSNGGPIRDTRSQIPNRRFYLYPELIPHAAAALGMVIPPTPYFDPHSVFQYPHYEGHEEEEEEEEIEEHHEHKFPTPIQLFNIMKQKQQKKRVKKKKKGKKTIKKIKKPPKGSKKCMPFSFSIIKKSDLNNDYYKNIRKQLPYGYQDEYFPQNSNSQDMALITFNTSSLSSNGTLFPGALHMLYPSYAYATPSRSHIRILPRQKMKFSRLPGRHLIRPYKIPKRPWSQKNSWRLASPGKHVSEYPLQEPLPSAIGGSPPPSPLYNVYQDNRIPVKLSYEQTEASDYNKVGANYLHLYSSTPSYVPNQYYEEQYREKTTSSEKPSTQAVEEYKTKYSDHDYYRFGTYTQNSFQNEDQRRPFYVRETQTERNALNNEISGQYYYQDYASSISSSTSTEKVVTVTPATFWVPVPQSYKTSPQAFDSNLSNSHKIKTYTPPQATDSNLSSSHKIKTYSPPHTPPQATDSNLSISHKIKTYTPPHTLPHTPPQATDSNLSSSHKIKTYTISGHTQKHYISAGYRNLTSFENSTLSSNYGDRIVPKNFSTERNNYRPNNEKAKNRKRIPNRKGLYKYYNKQKLENETNLETTTEGVQYKKASSVLNVNPYMNVVPHVNRGSLKYPKDSTLTNSINEGRSFRQFRSNSDEFKNSETEIITAKYPQDDMNDVHSSSGSLSSIRVERSNPGFSTVVSGSLLVKDN